MKKRFKHKFFMGFFLSLFLPNIAFSQGIINSGLTQQQETEMLRNKAGYSFNNGSNSGSALQQLENMTGQKISNSRSNSASEARSNSAAEAVESVVRPISSADLFRNNMRMELASGIASAVLGMMFNNKAKIDQKAIEEQRLQVALLARRAAAEQRYNDSIEQVKYVNMIKSYKFLNNTNSVQFKTLSTNNIKFKSINDYSAPMSMAEIERQNLIKRGISVTWDFKTWAEIAPNRNKIEELPNTQEMSECDKYLEAAINKIEIFQGGRIAALAGRYMVNIKNETMSYLKDASDAAVSGNISKMDEAGKFDLRKISSNALYKTGQQTTNAYIEQGKDFITGEIQDANFAIMKSGGMEMLQKYKIYSHVSDDWKVFLRKY